MFHLPSRSCLRLYTGKSTGEIGVTALVERRLREEAKNLSDSERIVNIQIDEMTIKPSEKYNRNFGKYFGGVDMGGVVQTPKNQLANKVLAFVMSGFSTHYRIPVAIFFVKQLTAEEQTKLTIHVIERIEVCGFSTFRLVTDNLSTNVKMFSLLSNGILSPVVPHPVDEIAKSLLVPCIFRPLVLSFDPCHAFKNVRNQAFDRTLEINGQLVSFAPVLKIYEMQQRDREAGSLALPVRTLTKKHVMPNNMERQKVNLAIDIFRPDVIATIEMHAANKVPGFRNVEGLVTFMKTFQKWFALHDVSSTKEFITKRLPDKMPFFASNDERLTWLDIGFPVYLDDKWHNIIQNRLRAMPSTTKEEKQKRKAETKKMFTKETLEALKFTSKSTVFTVRHLLDNGFHFVLTRRFSSDDVERFFGSVRQMMGGNFQGDAYGVLTSFERILRTGIAYASVHSNVVLRRESDRQYGLIMEKSSKKRARNELRFLPSSKLRVLDELINAPSRT